RGGSEISPDGKRWSFPYPLRENEATPGPGGTRRSTFCSWQFLLSTDQALTWALQSGLHPGNLAWGKHNHRVIIDIVHVVHEHVAVGPVVARHMGKLRLAEIRLFGAGGVIDQIVPVAIGEVAPDVAQVEEMTDLVGSRATQVERSGG